MASAFAFAALFPSDAYAEWVQVGAGQYCYLSASEPSTFKYSPIASANTACTNILRFSNNHYWYTSHAGASPWLVRYANIGGGALSEGNRIQLTNLGNVQIGISSDGTSGNTNYYYVNANDFRVYVSGSGGADLTRLYANDKGVYVLPFSAQYVVVVCRLTMPGAVTGSSYWQLTTINDFKVNTERPEDQNEVAAINDQTETLTSTEGSDTVTGDAMGDATGQIEGLQIFGLGESIAQGVSDAITTQEVDGSVTFPGMSLAGFVVPSVSVRPMELAPESLRPVIRLMVTFVFCAAFVSHIVQLLHAIFGIWEYGAGAEDFGGGSYDMGPRPVAWKSHDYGVDEDLGF